MRNTASKSLSDDKRQSQSNAIVARWARDALREYDRVSGGGCTVRGTIPLLIASLLHLADKLGGEGELIADEARTLYLSERR